MVTTWQYIQRKQIDPLKWDHCICTSTNSVVYALVEYLDHVADNWDALVYGDYEAVMPLPWKQKFGIRYVYTPFFIQRLGLFGKRLTANMYEDVLKIAGSHFYWIDCNVDQGFLNSDKVIRSRTNFVIDLNRPYASIRYDYSTKCIQHLKKALQKGCSLDENIPASDVIELFRSAVGHHLNATKDNYKRFEELINASSVHFKVHKIGIRNDASNELIFGGILVEFGNRLFYLMGSSTEEGRNSRANYYFIDRMIQKFSNSERIFDFEGSDLPNVATFFKQFGPGIEQYVHLKINNLPWYLRLFKS